MLEPLRSQYLAALGIDNYVPRFILPVAKSSAPCEWLETLEENPNTSAPIDARVVVDQSVNQQARAEKSADETLRRAPIIDAVSKRANENANATSASAPATALPTNDAPQFALSIVLAAGGLLLIDAAPASSAERSAYQKLLNNMLPALRPAAAQYVLDIFIWPHTRQPKVARDANAAIETLAAFLHKQIQQRAVDTVLLLGETAQRWCTLADTDVRVVKSTSLLACAQDPALKRPLWNDIRHLAQN